ncbi:MAG: YitT family protein [Limnohabitans sp.]
MNPAENQFKSRSGHSFLEDVQGLFTGTLLVALAVLFFKTASLLTGGTTGLAFLIHYPFGWPIGAILFVINLPFYVFGYQAMGRMFTVKTFASVGLLSFYIEVLPRWIQIQGIDPVFAAIMGGLLAGTGILILIRHGASLGGVSIMAIYLQKVRHWRAGIVQMGVDVAILLLGLWVLSPTQVMLSVLGAFALNMVIAINHRAGRYFTV